MNGIHYFSLELSEDFLYMITIVNIAGSYIIFVRINSSLLELFSNLHSNDLVIETLSRSSVV